MLHNYIPTVVGTLFGGRVAELEQALLKNNFDALMQTGVNAPHSLEQWHPANRSWIPILNGLLLFPLPPAALVFSQILLYVCFEGVDACMGTLVSNASQIVQNYPIRMIACQIIPGIEPGGVVV